MPGQRLVKFDTTPPNYGALLAERKAAHSVLLQTRQGHFRWFTPEKARGANEGVVVDGVPYIIQSVSIMKQGCRQYFLRGVVDYQVGMGKYPLKGDTKGWFATQPK